MRMNEELGQLGGYLWTALMVDHLERILIIDMTQNSFWHIWQLRNQKKKQTPMIYLLDAVGSWQIILPMPNLGRPY